MEKIILLTVLLFLILSFGAEVLAQGIELPDPGLTPDSPFYFLKSWKEKIQLFFAFSAENKAKQYLHFSEVRLAEYKKMIEKGKTEIAQKILDKYQKQLGRALEKAETAKEKGKDIEELAILITEKTLKHQEILIEVFEKVPEEAKTAIEKAIEVSRKGSEEAIQAVTGAKKEELQQKVEEVKTRVEEVKELPYPIMRPSPETLRKWIEEYEKAPTLTAYKALGTVLSITKINEYCEVRMSIQATEKYRTDYTESYNTNSFLLKLDDSSLKKYGIEMGKTFDCYINVITTETGIQKIEYNCPSIKTVRTKILQGSEKLDCPYECCIDEQYKTKTCLAGYECQENKCIKIIEEKKECLKEGETYMPGDNKQCCAGLKGISLSVGDGRICSLTAGYVCTAFCGDGKCEGEYENACSCPEDCLKEPVVGGDCIYDAFKGKCKITSIINENTIKFKFTPTEPLSEKAKWVDLTREREKYVGYLGLECLKNKYPITKEDLEKCHIKENTVFDCELEVITSGTCTPIIFKFYANELIEKEISYDGIVLVRAGSGLEDAAEEIANKKGWFFLTVDSSDPVEIRNTIIANNKNAEYLLIIGDDAEIPVIERSKELIADKYRANHGFAPLDMLYYGNVDEDYFIELSVGRLPFSSPDEVRQYFNTLPKIKENHLAILEYPAIGPPTADQIISILYYDTQYIKTYTKPMKDDAFSAVESGGTVIVSAHASASCFGAFCKGDIPAMNKNVIVIANSCNMAKQVGKDFLNRGAAAFLGFYFTAAPEVNFSFLLKEPTIGKALKRRVNEIISMAEVRTSGREGRTGRADIIEHVPDFVIPSVLVLYGDPTINISYAESLITVKTTPDSIKIQLPFKLSNLDHYSHFNPIIVSHIQQGEYFKDEKNPFIRNDVFIKVDESEIDSLPANLTVFSKVNLDMRDPIMEDLPFDYAVVYDKEWTRWYHILFLEKSVLQHSTTASIVVNNTQIDLYGGAELLMGDKEAYLVIAITTDDLVEMLHNQIPNGPVDIIIPLD